MIPGNGCVLRQFWFIAMSDDFDSDCQRWSQWITSRRRLYDRLWLVILLVLASGGAFVAVLTHDWQYVGWGLFSAGFAAVGLVYNHFFLLSPRRDPLETKHRLEALARSKQVNARRITLVNGVIFLLAAPVFMLLIVGEVAEQYGIVGALVAGIATTSMFAAGIWFIWRLGRAPFDTTSHGISPQSDHA
jgi:hypothetical protein